MATRTQQYTGQPGFPSRGVTSVRITTALRIANRYRGRVPEVKQLMRDFGMSKATAYRWANAIRDEQEEACGH